LTRRKPVLSLAALGGSDGHQRRTGVRRIERRKLLRAGCRTGKLLWEMQTGDEIVANPVGFVIDGKQHVAIAAGQTLIVFGL
jgi:hypothetical protein